MTRPEDILATFAAALDIEPAEGHTREQVLQALLDETVRRAIRRAQGDPQQLGAALRSPYTPLGSPGPTGVEGRARQWALHGPQWGPAVQAPHQFIERHAAALCAAFRDEAEPQDRV
jgi:hypothetical protein